MTNQSLLKFGKANDKLKKLELRLGVRLYTFSLPAGYSCPGASLCRSRFDSISDGIYRRIYHHSDDSDRCDPDQERDIPDTTWGNFSSWQ